MTVEEYFQLEENDPDTRYEYVDGYVYACENEPVSLPYLH
jgi:Uma2 family endonuclease